MSRSTLPGAVGAMLLAIAGCVPAPVQPTAPPPPDPGRAAPELDPQRWPFTDGQPYLQPDGQGWGFLPHVRFAVFQTEGGGEYDLMLSCSDRHLSLHYFPPEGVTRDRESLTVASGSARATIAAQYTPSTVAPPPDAVRPPSIVEEKPSFDATAQVTDPFFQGFLRTGRLSVSNSGRTLVADVAPGELDWLRRFFRPCLTPPENAPD